MPAHCATERRSQGTIRLRRIFGIGDASPNADDAWAAQLRSSPRRKPPPRVPNRRPRFPTSTPPPGPSAYPSGFSIRSQQDYAGFNPAVFKAPVRTPVATEFNSGEQAYSTINTRSPSIGKFVPAANPPPRILNHETHRMHGSLLSRVDRVESGS